MVLDVTRVDVWAASIDDRPGGLAKKLAPLAEAVQQLEFVIARRAPGQARKGVVFLTPLKGAAQIRAAKKAGFKKTKGLHSLRVEGPDKPGLGAQMTQLLAQAGINLRGLAAATIGGRCVVNLAFDSAANASKAAGLLEACVCVCNLCDRGTTPCKITVICSLDGPARDLEYDDVDCCTWGNAFGPPPPEVGDTTVYTVFLFSPPEDPPLFRIEADVIRFSSSRKSFLHAHFESNNWSEDGDPTTDCMSSLTSHPLHWGGGNWGGPESTFMIIDTNQHPHT